VLPLLLLLVCVLRAAIAAAAAAAPVACALADTKSTLWQLWFFLEQVPRVHFHVR
jgi:hypothetical protein